MATVKDLARPESLIDNPTVKRNYLNSKKADAITPSDVVDLINPSYRRYVIGGAGTVTFMKFDGTTVQYTAVAGQTIDILAKRVMFTGTAASLIVGEV